MIAVMRYAYLKTRRDSSLIAFIGIEMLVPLAALAGATLAQGHLRYPFYLNSQFSPVQNATLAAQISTGVCVLFTVITAFWTFRPEIATRSIGSFFFGAHPLTVALALILFSAAVGLAGWIGAMATIGVLTTALPQHLALLGLKVAAGCLGAGAFGTLVVTISTQPGMVIGSYVACAVVTVWVEKSSSFSQVIAALAAAIVCTALAGFLLERRCAT